MALCPFRCDDGNYAIAKEISRDISFPFSAVGDNDSFEVKIREEVNKEDFKKLPLMSKRTFAGLGIAYFVTQGDPTDVGSGLYQYDRTWAMTPNTRVEYESASFTLKFLTPQVGFTIEADFQALTVAEATYEYFNNVKPDVIYAPRFYFTGFIPEIVTVQDSEISIYKGKIYQRKTLYANIADIKFFFG